MNRKGSAVGLAILFAIGLGVVYTAWKMGPFSPARFCDACQRPLHSLSRFGTSGETGLGEPGMVGEAECRADGC